MQVLFMRCYDIVYYIFVAHISAREEIESLANGGKDLPSPSALSPQPADGKDTPQPPAKEAPKKNTPRACKCMQACVVS